MLVSLSSNNLDASQVKLAKASEWEKLFACVCRFATRFQKIIPGIPKNNHANYGLR